MNPKEQESSALILNSVSNLEKAIPLLAKYEKINSFLDNDTAGKDARNRLLRLNLPIENISERFSDFKDLNDFLCQKQIPKEISMKSKRKIKLRWSFVAWSLITLHVIYFASSLEKPQHNYGSSKSNQAELGRAISIIQIFWEASLCFGLPKTCFSPYQREVKNHPDGLIIDRIFMDDNTTNKGGRPKKKLSEKRSYSVLLKLNTKEYFTLKSKANEAG